MMPANTFRIALTALAISGAAGWSSAVHAQVDIGLPPRIPAQNVSSSSGVRVAVRPSALPELQPAVPFQVDQTATQVPVPAVPGASGAAVTGLAPDGTGPSDEVKTAIGQVPPTTPETGRLSPITMESVRAPIAAADIRVLDIGTRVLPEDQAAKLSVPQMPLPNGSDRALSALTYRWQAANICHLPLYFEEPMLERNGVHRCPSCLQPAVSGTKFLGNLVLYPYRATLWPAFENRYTLGHFRPGSCAPALRDDLPWSTDAALVQAGAATAVVVGLPW